MKSMQNPSLNANSTIALLGSLDAKFSAKRRTQHGRTLAPVSMDSRQISRAADANKVESLHKLAVLYHSRKNYGQAERLYQESLTIYSMQYGMEDPRVGQCLNNVGRLYMEEGMYSEAEVLLDRSLEIVRDHYGPEHPKVAKRLANLGELYNATERAEQAAEFYEQALNIEKTQLGGDSTQTTRTMRALASTLRKLQRTAEAEELEKQYQLSRRPDRRLQALRRMAESTTTGVSSKISAGERRRRPERRHSTRRD